MDEVKEILEFACPNKWKTAMAVHNFNIIQHSTTELIEFCERMEFAEANSNNYFGQNGNSQRGKGSKSAAQRSNSNTNSNSNSNNNNNHKNSKKWGVLHKSDTHDTGECKVVLAQAKKMRSTWEAGGVAKGSATYGANGNGNGNGANNGKSVGWKSKPTDNFALELGTLIGKMINSAATQNSSAGAKDDAEPMDTESTNQNDENGESDDDVEVVEQYNLDTIDGFLTNAKIANDDAKKNETPIETKKNREMGRIEDLAQEVSHEYKNIFDI